MPTIPTLSKYDGGIIKGPGSVSLPESTLITEHLSLRKRLTHLNLQAFNRHSSLNCKRMYLLYRVSLKKNTIVLFDIKL
jgi:hypothetical protein